ncbi:hypothetical protein E2C01_061314 [Portunus trituberculatus]|uniref:Uncharacterized protein n=1 Tax=Portunus trituberculatus TaxID=210409 RepID=A0A5B7HE20_PORTR|nr:hypothetical protein [Portunus trituberculatus]
MQRGGAAGVVLQQGVVEGGAAQRLLHGLQVSPGALVLGVAVPRVQVRVKARGVHLGGVGVMRARQLAGRVVQLAINDARRAVAPLCAAPMVVRLVVVLAQADVRLHVHHTLEQPHVLRGRRRRARAALRARVTLRVTLVPLVQAARAGSHGSAAHHAHHAHHAPTPRRLRLRCHLSRRRRRQQQPRGEGRRASRYCGQACKIHAARYFAELGQRWARPAPRHHARGGRRSSSRWKRSVSGEGRGRDGEEPPEEVASAEERSSRMMAVTSLRKSSSSSAATLGSESHRGSSLPSHRPPPLHPAPSLLAATVAAAPSHTSSSSAATSSSEGERPSEAEAVTVKSGIWSGVRMPSEESSHVASPGLPGLPATSSPSSPAPRRAPPRTPGNSGPSGEESVSCLGRAVGAGVGAGAGPGMPSGAASCGAGATRESGAKMP